MYQVFPSYLLSPEAWVSVTVTVLLVRLSSKGTFNLIDSLFVDLKVLKPTQKSFRRAYGKDSPGNNNSSHSGRNSHHQFSSNKSQKYGNRAPSNSHHRGNGGNHSLSNYNLVERRIKLLEFTYTRIKRCEMADTAKKHASADVEDFYSFLGSAANYSAGCCVGVILIWVLVFIRRLYYSCHDFELSARDGENNIGSQYQSAAAQARISAIYPTLFVLLCNAQITISFLGGTVSDVVGEIQQKTMQTRMMQILIGLAVFGLLRSGLMLQLLGVSSIGYALEEFSARLLLFNCYMYNIAPRNTVYVIELIDKCTSLTRIVLSIVAGSVIGDFISPVFEKCQVAVAILKGSWKCEGDEEHSTSCNFLIHLGIICNAVIPCFILDTYFNGQRYNRVVLTWIWVFVDIALVRPLLQKYLYLAVHEASSDLGLKDISYERLQRHFVNQYRSLVISASGYCCTSLFVMLLLLFAHMCGNEGRFDGENPVAEINFDLSKISNPTPVYDYLQERISSLPMTNGLICPPVIIDDRPNNEKLWDENPSVLWASSSPNVPTTLSNLFSGGGKEMTLVALDPNASINLREDLSERLWSFDSEDGRRISLTDEDFDNKESDPYIAETTLTTMFFHKFVSPTIVYAITNFFGLLFCCMWIVCYTVSGLVLCFQTRQCYSLKIANNCETTRRLNEERNKK